MTIKGMPLYASVSATIGDNGYTHDQQDILMFRYIYQRELLPNLYLDVRFEPHVNLNQPDKQLQFNHSFFLTYKENFKLFKIKK